MVTSGAIVEPQTRCSAEFRMCPDDHDQVCGADGALLCRAALPSCAVACPSDLTGHHRVLLTTGTAEE